MLRYLNSCCRQGQSGKLARQRLVAMGEFDTWSIVAKGLLWSLVCCIERVSVSPWDYGGEKFGVQIKMACSGLLLTFCLYHGVQLLCILQLNSCDCGWATSKNMALLRIPVPRTSRLFHILDPALLAVHMFIYGGTLYYYVCEYMWSEVYN